MSETPVPSPAPEAPAGDGITAGMLLRHAREAAGLHEATLAAMLKVPVRKLEALENDRYDELPDAVFVRALASSICRTLKVDPHPVLERLPQTAQPRLVQDSPGINAPFRAPGDGPSPGWADQLTRPVALTVIALLLAAVVLIFLPVAQRGVQTARQGGSEPVMPPANAPVPPEARPVDTPAPSTESPVPSAPVAATTAPAAQPAATAAPAAAPARPVASAAAPAATPASAAAAAPATAGASAPTATGVVVFRTRGPSWIEVTDANGKTVLRKLMAAGESAGADGNLPLSVTVGSVEQTDVTVRGKPYNLAPVSRDNVARFRVQ